jgi:hypothetical protein
MVGVNFSETKTLETGNENRNDFLKKHLNKVYLLYLLEKLD